MTLWDGVALALGVAFCVEAVGIRALAWRYFKLWRNP